jgi:hypothetical protein
MTWPPFSSIAYQGSRSVDTLKWKNDHGLGPVAIT